MANNPSPLDLGPRVRILQVIVGAMLMGILFFGIVAVALNPMGEAEGRDGSSPLTLIAFVAVIGVMLARPLVLIATDRRNRRRIAAMPGRRSELGGADDALLLAEAFSTRTIVGAALLEGAAFLVLVAYMVERSPWALFLAAALMLALATQLPSMGRMTRWIESELEQVHQERTRMPG